MVLWKEDREWTPGSGRICIRDASAPVQGGREADKDQEPVSNVAQAMSHVPLAPCLSLSGSGSVLPDWTRLDLAMLPWSQLSSGLFLPRSPDVRGLQCPASRPDKRAPRVSWV